MLTDAAGAALLGGVGVPVVVTADPRRCLGALAASVYADPAADLALMGVTGTQGKTTTTRLLEEGLTARRHPRRSDRHRRHPDRRRRGEDLADHARGARPARPLRGDARGGGGRVRDGGVQPRAGPRPGRRRGLRRGRVPQPRPRPPGLPCRRGGVLRRQGHPVHTRARSARADQHRRRVRPQAPRRGGHRDAHLLDRGPRGRLAGRRHRVRHHRLALHRGHPGGGAAAGIGRPHRRLQRQQRAGSDRAGCRGRLRPPGDRHGHRRGRRSPRPARERPDGPGVPRSSSTTPTSPRRSGRPRRVAPADHRPADPGDRRRR